MDDRRFDDLARALAGGTSRRRLVKGLVGGLAAGMAALAGRNTAAAQDGLRLDVLACLGLTPHLAAQVCIALNLPHVARTGCVDGRCAILACKPGWANCDGKVQTGCETPLGTRDNCAACGDGCARLDDTCNVGACAGGSCVAQPANEGQPCDDGDVCTQTDTCQDGVCVGGDPVICTAQSQCHDVGTCDPTTGLCSNPPSAITRPCDDGDACTQADRCNGEGVCAAGDPVVCPNPEQTCDPGAGQCVCPPGQPLDCGAFCGVECCVNSQCSPTELCNADGVCVPQGIDLRRLGGGVMEVDDDLTISVNDEVVFTENDGFITNYPPFNLSLNNGDQIRVQAFNVQCCRAHIDAFELFRPSDGATQVLKPTTFDENGFGAGVVLDEFYDQIFTVNLPPNP